MNRFTRYVKREHVFEGSGAALSQVELHEIPMVPAKKAVTIEHVLESPEISVQKMKDATTPPPDVKENAEQMLARARQVANNNMKEHFFTGSNGDDKISVRHLENSESVITKNASNGAIGNAYTNIRAMAKDEGFEFSVIAAASQAPNKVKTPERLQNETAMHVAQAIFAHRMQFELNNRKGADVHAEHIFVKANAECGAAYTPPRIIAINNYMTDGSNAPGMDAKAVAPRKNAIKKIINSLKSGGDAAQTFQKQVTTHLMEMAKNTGLSLTESEAQVAVKSSVTAETLLFQQQGINSMRSFGSSSDASFLGELTLIKALGFGNDLTISKQAQEKSIELKQQELDSQAKHLDNLVAEYEKTRQAIVSSKVLNMFNTVGGIVKDFVTKGKILGHCKDENLELHKEALKLVMIAKMGGASVSGCKSAKDRMGVILAMARAQEQYMAKNDGKVAEPNDSAFKTMFAKEWLSGQLQYICDVNAPGAAAVKNPMQIIPPGFREAIKNEVKQQIAEASKIDTPESAKKKQQLIMFLPEVSHAISNLNKYPEKGEKAVEKITKVVKKSLETIEKALAFDRSAMLTPACPLPSLQSQKNETGAAKQADIQPPPKKAGLSSASIPKEVKKIHDKPC